MKKILLIPIISLVAAGTSVFYSANVVSLGYCASSPEPVSAVGKIKARFGCSDRDQVFTGSKVRYVYTINYALNRNKKLISRENFTSNQKLLNLSHLTFDTVKIVKSLLFYFVLYYIVFKLLLYLRKNSRSELSKLDESKSETSTESSDVMVRSSWKPRINMKALHYFLLLIYILIIFSFLGLNVILDMAEIACGAAPCPSPYKPLGGYLSGRNTNMFTPVIYIAYFLLTFYFGKFIFYKKLLIPKFD